MCFGETRNQFSSRIDCVDMLPSFCSAAVQYATDESVGMGLGDPC